MQSSRIVRNCMKYKSWIQNPALQGKSIERGIHQQFINFKIFKKPEHTRKFHISCVFNAASKEKDNKEIVPFHFFENVQDKNKNTYLDMIRIFNNRDVHKRGHVEFIYAAMKYLEDFGVHKDLEVYKALVDVFPKGKFIPTNIFQTEFQHYPKQQQCATDLLEKMEDNGVIPDGELETMLVNVFGKKGHPVRKMMRMFYWMPKFKNLSPWPVPNPVPNDALELAKLALQRIGSVDLQMKVDVLQAEDLEESIDKTWIVNAQSPTQQELLEKHPKDEPIYVEGAFRVWLRGAAVIYFVLRAEPKPDLYKKPSLDEIDDVSNLKTLFDEASMLQVVHPRSVHEQDEGTILALAATGTSSKDSLLSWIRLLQRSNPNLGSVPVLFSLTSPFGHVVPVTDASEQTDSHLSQS